MSLSISVAVAQPSCRPGDVVANTRSHAAAVAAAHSRVVVFPELSLTGYVLDAPSVDLTSAWLEPLIGVCDELGSVALVGAPFEEDAGRYIAVLAVSGGGVELAYRKMVLGGEEPPTFMDGPAPATREVDGWRIGLGICKDTGAMDHVDATAALGIDLYAAGIVHRPDELALQDERGKRITGRVGVPVAFASAAGPSGPGYERTSGHSTIWSANGSVMARAGSGAGVVVTATLGRDGDPVRPQGLDPPTS